MTLELDLLIILGDSFFFIFNYFLLPIHPFRTLNFLKDIGHVVLKIFVVCFLFPLLLSVHQLGKFIDKFHYQIIVVTIASVFKFYLAVVNVVVLQSLDIVDFLNFWRKLFV